MATEVFANDAAATVTSGGTSAPAAGTTETWTLAASTLPAVSSSASPPTQCYAADPAPGAETEKILITNISGTAATVTRGADGTTPVAHSVPFTIEQVLTRASLEALQSGGGGVQIAGDLGGTGSDPEVVSTHLTSPLPVAQGGTGTATGAGQNDVFAGPGSGGAGAPAFRALVAADLPAATSSAQGAVQLAGDLGGTAALPEVLKIQGTGIAEPTGDATQYLNGQGDWTVPAGGGGGMANPMTTLGDMIIGAASGDPSRLPGDTSGTRKFLRTQASGGAAAEPAWDTITAADLPPATTSAQGAVQLDGTASDIQPPGTQAAGSTGKAADAGHVHPATGLVTTAQVGAAGGVASLNSSGVVPAAELPPATTSAQGTVELAGDFGGTASSPEVVSTHLASPLPVAQGGTGTATGAAQNTVLAGPGSGGAGAPSFRALTTADMPPAFVPRVVTLTDGSSVALSAAAGNLFRWPLGGASHTLAAPTSPSDGQVIKIRIIYGGAYTPLFATAYSFVAMGGTPAWTAASGKVDVAGFEYDADANSGAGLWVCIGWTLGS